MQYLQKFHQNQHYDLLLVFGEDCIPVNKTLLAVHSPYFQVVTKDCQGDTLDFKFIQQFGDSRVFQVLLAYLQSGFLVVP